MNLGTIYYKHKDRWMDTKHVTQNTERGPWWVGGEERGRGKEKGGRRQSISDNNEGWKSKRWEKNYKQQYLQINGMKICAKNPLHLDSWRASEWTTLPTLWVPPPTSIPARPPARHLSDTSQQSRMQTHSWTLPPRPVTEGRNEHKNLSQSWISYLQ